MKKNLLILFAVFVSCSYPLYSQLGSPILVLPPEQANFQPTAITLDWEDVTNATGYLVDISTTPIFPAYPADSVNAFSSQFTFPAGLLATNQTYYARVTAHNSNGFGPSSVTRTFRTAGTVNQEMANLQNAVAALNLPNSQAQLLYNRLDQAQNKIDNQLYTQAIDKLESFQKRAH